jgi:hypothetical protein
MIADVIESSIRPHKQQHGGPVVAKQRHIHVLVTLQDTQQHCSVNYSSATIGLR